MQASEYNCKMSVKCNSNFFLLENYTQSIQKYFARKKIQVFYRRMHSKQVTKKANKYNLVRSYVLSHVKLFIHRDK